MTLGEFKEKLNGMSEKKRNGWMEKVAKMMAPPSIAALNQFQKNWFIDHPNAPKDKADLLVVFAKFRKGQDEVILEALNSEVLASSGKLRLKMKMDILTWETEIK